MSCALLWFWKDIIVIEKDYTVIVKAYNCLQTSWDNDMNFLTNHAPDAGSIASQKGILVVYHAFFPYKGTRKAYICSPRCTSLQLLGGKKAPKPVDFVLNFSETSFSLRYIEQTKIIPLVKIMSDAYPARNCQSNLKSVHQVPMNAQ